MGKAKDTAVKSVAVLPESPNNALFLCLNYTVQLHLSQGDSTRSLLVFHCQNLWMGLGTFSCITTIAVPNGGVNTLQTTDC